MKTKLQAERIPEVEVTVNMEDAVKFLHTMQGRVNYRIDEDLKTDPPLYHMVDLIKEQQKLQLLIEHFQKLS